MSRGRPTDPPAPARPAGPWPDSSLPDPTRALLDLHMNEPGVAGYAVEPLVPSRADACRLSCAPHGELQPRLDELKVDLAGLK